MISYQEITGLLSRDHRTPIKRFTGLLSRDLQDSYQEIIGLLSRDHRTPMNVL